MKAFSGLALRISATELICRRQDRESHIDRVLYIDSDVRACEQKCASRNCNADCFCLLSILRPSGGQG